VLVLSSDFPSSLEGKGIAPMVQLQSKSCLEKQESVGCACHFYRIFTPSLEVKQRRNDHFPVPGVVEGAT
jgi:hypothetical protein